MPLVAWEASRIPKVMDTFMLVKPGKRHLYKGMVACICILVEGSVIGPKCARCMHAVYREYGDEMMTLKKTEHGIVLGPSRNPCLSGAPSGWSVGLLADNPVCLRLACA